MSRVAGQQIEVSLTGPLFDGRAGPEMDALSRDLVDAVADHILTTVRTLLGQSVLHATGRYESRLVTERRADDVAVTDRGVVYGPWLEGTSRRNASTGFAGYRSFRRAAQDAAANVDRITGPVVARHVRALG